MVTGNYSYEEQTRRRLSEAKTKEHEIEEQIKVLDKQHLRLTREIDAYETILEGYKDTTHKTLANPYPRTPAMAAGISNHIWTVDEIVRLTSN